MGAPWRDHPAWSIVETAQQVTAQPLERLLLDASAEELSRTRDAQLAVFLTSLVAWEAVRDHIPAPVAFAGHSLGQLTALVATGSLAIEDGVRLAVARADATQAAADRRPGRMAVLLGADLATAVAVAERSPDTWVANDNAPGQIVLGGTPEGMDAATETARRSGVKKVLPLAVGGAFHTPLMAPARDTLGPLLANVDFAAPRVAVVANTDAAAHRDADWADRLAEHLVSPVRWRQTMEHLAESGVDRVIELGAGRTLGGLARRTVPQVDVLCIETPADLPAAAARA
jgi:[acyl-carrier-protein] S-malonyltransferase